MKIKFKILNMKDKNTYMPVKDFAEKKGVSVQAIYQGLGNGTYSGKKIGNYQLVKVD